MARLSLPDPKADASTTLRDASEAQAWAAAQPQTQPMRLLRAALTEIEGIDSSAIAPAVRVDMLDALRPAIVLAENAQEVRYANKPLPLLPDEANAFDAAWRVWFSLAVAYLRASAFLPPAEALRPLHRAAIALREALHCHYIAGQEASPLLPQLLYELLLTAESRGLERTTLPDPEYKHIGESSIVADISWSFLLHFCDPYRFSAAQFAVANRALSRWRELAGFQAQPDDSPKSRVIALAPWLGENVITADGPGYVDVKPVIRKIRKRIEALEAGESPDSLKLGRELAAPACITLLQMISDALRPDARFSGDGISPQASSVELILGNENMFAAIAGEPLEGVQQVNAKSDRLSHERIALFGFDNMATRADSAVETNKIPSETWGAEEGWILRAANAGAQVWGPALVAVREDGKIRLAVMISVRQSVEGWLMATLRRLPDPPAAGVQRIANVPVKSMPLTPVFLLPEDSANGHPTSICLPTGTGARPGGLMALERCNVPHLRLTDVIERGTNFVRFGYVRT